MHRWKVLKGLKGLNGTEYLKSFRGFLPEIQADIQAEKFSRLIVIVGFAVVMHWVSFW